MPKNKHPHAHRYERYKNLSTSYSPGERKIRPPQKLQPLENKKAGLSKQFWTWKKSGLSIFIVLLIPLLIIGAWDLRNFSRASSKLFGSGNVVSLLTPNKLDSTREGRVNVLLIGYSVDDPEHRGAKLTDSIMILSLDKEKKTGQMLSVPRDLYVNIPGYGRAKINEAYQAGERKNGSQNEGAELLKQVIVSSFGIDIHYFMIINYQAVREVVDAVGGVNVNITSPDPRGIYDPNFLPHEGGPLKLPNGQSFIDGPTALRLTRARGSTFGSYGFPQSDFNRTQNQQMVLASIKSELNWRVVLDPRTNSKIFDAAASNISTDVNSHEVLPLFRLINAVNTEKLSPIVLNNVAGQNLLTGFQTPTGQSALVPAAGTNNFSEIQRVLKKLGF